MPTPPRVLVLLLLVLSPEAAAGVDVLINSLAGNGKRKIIWFISQHRGKDRDEEDASKRRKDKWWWWWRWSRVQRNRSWPSSSSHVLNYSYFLPLKCNYPQFFAFLLHNTGASAAASLIQSKDSQVNLFCSRWQSVGPTRRQEKEKK